MGAAKRTWHCDRLLCVHKKSDVQVMYLDHVVYLDAISRVARSPETVVYLKRRYKRYCSRNARSRNRCAPKTAIQTTLRGKLAIRCPGRRRNASGAATWRKDCRSGAKENKVQRQERAGELPPGSRVCVYQGAVWYSGRPRFGGLL